MQYMYNSNKAHTTNTSNDHIATVLCK